MQCSLCKANKATNHGTTVINGEMTVEDLCPACFATRHPEMNATLKRPWICDYCGSEAQSCESPLDKIMAHSYPIKQEFMCNNCRTAIDDEIQSAISRIKIETKDDELISQLVVKAVEAAYQNARSRRFKHDSL